jgi:hypothetical protein
LSRLSFFVASDQHAAKLRRAAEGMGQAAGHVLDLPFRVILFELSAIALVLRTAVQRELSIFIKASDGPVRHRCHCQQATILLRHKHFTARDWHRQSSNFSVVITLVIRVDKSGT